MGEAYNTEMSYQSLVKAMKLAPKCRFYTTAGGKSEEEIEQSERVLNISFSNQHREFLSKYGYLSFAGNEIFGINPDGDSGILEDNSVAYAINDRKEYHLPKEWIPIYNFEDGNMAYLDYSSLNIEKEPKVIMAFYDGAKYVIVETIADDFGDFFLQLVNGEIEG